MRNHTGITLIEFILVIVILSVLASLAIPAYINLRTDAQQAATSQVAGQLSAACSSNFAVRSSKVSTQSYNRTQKITVCSDGWKLMQNNSMQTSYLTSGTPYTPATQQSCLLTLNGNSSIKANYICPLIA
jgi:MSHA pilin protein MshA